MFFGRRLAPLSIVASCAFGAACSSGPAPEGTPGEIGQAREALGLCLTDASCAYLGAGYTCKDFACRPPSCTPRTCSSTWCGTAVDDGCGGLVSCSCQTGSSCSTVAPGVAGTCSVDDPGGPPACPAEVEWTDGGRLHADTNPLGPIDGGILRFYGSSNSCSSDALAFGCNSSILANDVVFRFSVRTRGQFTFDSLGSSYDTVLGLFPAWALGFGLLSKLACDDDGGTPPTSRISVTLDPGDYYLVLSGHSATGKGDYRVRISAATPTCQVSCLRAPTNLSDHISRYQCLDPAGTLCSARVHGRAKADRQAAAEQFLAGSMSSQQHLALVRDRTQKVRAAELSASVMNAICAGDADGDFVPNGSDHCPGTHDLRATDAVGCELTTLPPAVPDEMIRAVLDRIGVVLNPACVGSTLPTEPRVLQRVLKDTGGRYVLGLYPPAVAGSPPACDVWYQFEGTVTLENGTQKYFRFLLSTNDPRVKPPNFSTNIIAVDLHSTDGPEFNWGNSASAINYHVRFINGAGLRSAWSESVNVPITLPPL